MSVQIDYSCLKSATKDLKKAGEKSDQYAERLQNKVIDKLDNLTKGSSRNTSNASYFASAKVKALNVTSTNCTTLSKKIDSFVTKAKETDRNVANYIKTEGNAFRKANGLSYGWFDGFAEAIARFGAILSGINDFTRWITDKLRGISDAINAIWLRAKHWIWCDGGKYVLKVVLAVAAIVFAVVAVIVAWPVFVAALVGTATVWTFIVATCTLVTAVIALGDSVVSLFTNIQAFRAHKEDPGWAARYSSMNSMSSWLYKTNFDNKYLNIITNVTSVALDVISTLCAVVTIADGIMNICKFFSNAYRANANWKNSFKMWTKDGKFSFDAFKKNFSYNVKAFYDSFGNNHSINQMKGVAKRKYDWYKKFSEFTKGTDFRNIKKAYGYTKTFINNLVNRVSFKDYINSKIEKAVMDKVDPLDVKGVHEQSQKIDKKLAAMGS